jgi:methylmalonyl-CoA mutase C-terminal domain/subunit
MPPTKPIRILLAKTGLDGHDRGAKVLAALLQRQGFEVVYLGLYNTVEMVVQGAIEEDVDLIGLSFLSGEHLSITKKLMAELKRREVDDIPVIIGGILPPEDVETLLEMGVMKVFRGSMARDVVEFLSSNFTR